MQHRMPRRQQGSSWGGISTSGWRYLVDMGQGQCLCEEDAEELSMRCSEDTCDVGPVGLNSHILQAQSAGAGSVG